MSDTGLVFLSDLIDYDRTGNSDPQNCKNDPASYQLSSSLSAAFIISPCSYINEEQIVPEQEVRLTFSLTLAVLCQS